MKNISVLDKFTWTFQVFGLQSFSIKNIEKKKEKNYPSRFYCIYTMILLTWASVFAYLTINEFRHSAPKMSNHLSLVIKFVNYGNYIISLYLCLILSFFKYRQLVKFFKNSAKVSLHCFTEFGHKENFKTTKRELIKLMTIYATFFAILFYQIITADFGDSGIVGRLILPMFWQIVAVFIEIIVFRFNFYVRIINFHLKVMCDLIRGNFINELKIPAEKIIFEKWKVPPNKFVELRKVVALRKNYLLLREMSELVNETMGFIMFLRLFMVSTNIIRFGYDFLSDINGSVATFGKVWCKKFHLF